jgi:hypothetical protein
MIRSLQVTALFVLSYATIVFARSEGMIQVRIFGIDGGIVPRWGAWLAHTWFSIFFFGGSFLLIKGYSAGWMKSIDILGTRIQITEANRDIVVRGIWITCIGLVVSLAAVLIPTQGFGIDHIQMGLCLVIGVLTSFLPSMWALRAIKTAEEAVPPNGP